MLTPSKKTKLIAALKAYNKKYLHAKMKELDESGTRLMINDFLTSVLGFIPIDEVKTEYMIKGTYADYVIQLKGDRHFLVEVKALTLDLSDKHLRQAVNYGANEGIEWALLTNGRHFDLYKIIFDKPISSRKVFSVNLSDITQLKYTAEYIQYLHRDSVVNKGLNHLWNKNCALDPCHIAGFLYTADVTKILKRVLNKKFKCRFSDEEIHASLNRIVREPISLDQIKHVKVSKAKAKKAVPVKKEDHAMDILDPVAVLKKVNELPS